MSRRIHRAARVTVGLWAGTCLLASAWALTSDDTRFGEQWNLQAGDIGGINLAKAWDVTTGNAGTVIAVLDTGILPNHGALDATRILPGYDFVLRKAGATDPGDAVTAADNCGARPADAGGDAGAHRPAADADRQQQQRATADQQLQPAGDRQPGNLDRRRCRIHADQRLPGAPRLQGHLRCDDPFRTRRCRHRTGRPVDARRRRRAVAPVQPVGRGHGPGGGQRTADRPGHRRRRQYDGWQPGNRAATAPRPTTDRARARR